jgi:hypothetical protein
VRDERGRENGGRGQGVKGNGGHVAGSGNLNWNKTCLGATQSTVMTVRGGERESYKAIVNLWQWEIENDRECYKAVMLTHGLFVFPRGKWFFANVGCVRP